MLYLREADGFLLLRRWKRRGPQEDLFVPLLWFMTDFVGMQEEKNGEKSELDVSSVRASWTCLLVCLFYCVFLVSEKFSREFTIQHFMQRLS